MPVNYGSVPFPEQIKFFRNKVNIPTERWNDLKRDAHDTGFMVAGAAKADLLADLKDAVGKAVEHGTTLAAFRKDFDKIVAKHGWTGFTGSESEAGIAWRTRVIYETNLRTSYQAGRWQQIQAGKAYRPYLQYKHSHAVINARVEHLAWNGKVLAVDDPWWQSHYPPNGFGCQCTVFALSERDLTRLGKTGPDQAPNDGTYEWTDKNTGEVHTFPVGVQPFWDYAPGASLASRAVDQIARKLPNLPKGISNDLQGMINQLAPVEAPSVQSIAACFISPKTGAVKKHLTHVVEAIDKVHAVEGLPGIPVKASVDRKFQGKYAFNTKGEAVSITLSSASVNPELTLAHEIGHFIDHQVLGEPGIYASEDDHLFMQWRLSVEMSAATQKLKALKSDNIFVARCDYYLRTREQWARSYAQWLAIRSNDPLLLAQVNNIISGDGSESYKLSQWEASDFVAIAKAIDELFIQKGWLK